MRIVKCKDCGEKFDTEAGGLYRYQCPQLWTCPDCAGEARLKPTIYEIVLYVKQRMVGRVMVGDGEIVGVMENGRRRTPKSKSFSEAVKHIMDETDLVPAGKPQPIGAKSHFTTYQYIYRKTDVYVQSRYDRWAVAYPVEDYWMVKKAGQEVETRYESAQTARRAVDDWCGTVADLMELRRQGMVGEREEYLSAAQIRAKKRAALSKDELTQKAAEGVADLFG